MKMRMRSLLLELLKDSKKSDRELARVLGVSQPTVSRMRWKLVKEGVIREFTVIPDLVEMGYEIMAISSFRAKGTKETEERTTKVIMANPNIIFASEALGMRKNAVIITLHRNYADFSNFLRNLMLDSGDDLRDCDTLLVSLRGRIVKPLSLKYLAEQGET